MKLASALPKTSAYVALSIAALTTWGACRDLVAGDAQNIMDELCTTLDACYGGDPTISDCDTTLRQRLESGTENEVDAFVTYVGSHECFDTCPHALGCTDLAPFCQTGDEACVGRSDCCNWSLGVQDCVAGQCCKGRGQDCDELADECCENDCRNGFCGGSACVAVGEACTGSFDCCTQRCVLGKCEALSECAGLDESCKSDVDCCADTSVSEPDAAGLVCDLESHRCKPPSSCSLGSVCTLDEAGTQCCDEAGGLRCWPSLNGGVCGPVDCSPVDVDCESDGDCCGNGVCSYEGFPHCTIVNEGECSRSGDACTANEDCCSNACASLGPAAGTCLEFATAPCGEALACHDACVEGEAMSGTSCANDPTFSNQLACISAIVQADPFCGCGTWDTFCVEAALVPCGCP